METLQDFVSARLAGLSTIGGLNVRARQVVRTVSSTAASVRSAAPPQSARSTRPAPFVVGRDLPRMAPGVERC